LLSLGQAWNESTVGRGNLSLNSRGMARVEMETECLT
jgi:hypothetical protein